MNPSAPNRYSSPRRFPKSPLLAFIAANPLAVGQISTLDSIGVAIPTPPTIIPCATGFVMKLAEAGIDRNGDGDGLDTVWWILDPVTGAQQSLGIAATASGTILDGANLPADATLVPLRVSESAQGATDLNGDGDATDSVLFVYDTLSGAVSNTGFTPIWVSPPTPDGSFLPFAVSEFHLGVDVDQDGLLLDWVPHGFDRATGTVIATQVAFFPITSFEHFLAIDGPHFVYWQPEFHGGIDLNGDGDADDVVLEAHDPSTGITTNFGVFGELLTRDLGGPRVLVGVDELFSGSIDLNGDGDAADFVLHLFDSTLGSLLNLGVAAGPIGPTATDGTVPLGLSESAQGGTDFDGDGDASDFVIVLIDPSTLAMTSTGVAGWFAESITGPGQPLRWGILHAENSLAPFGTSIDLNGDGDTFDSVVKIFTPSTSTLVTSEVVATSMRAIGTDFGVLVSEQNHGATDFNGDGDALDYCVGTVDPHTAEIRVLPVGVHSGFAVDSNSHFAFLTDETAETLDLNGDGDLTDRVYRGFDLAAGTTFDTGIAGSSTTPQPNTSFVREAAGTFLLGVSESVVTQDLNGDGDLSDQVPTRYRPTIGSCGTIVSTGVSCADPAGLRPMLLATGCLNPSGDLVAVIRGGVPGKVAFFFAGSQPASISLPGGCALLVAPPAALVGPFPLTTQGLETGSIQLRADLPPTPIPGALHLQAFVTASVPSGYLATNGLTLNFTATP